MTNPIQKAKQVLVFNNRRVLVSIAKSANSLSYLLNTTSGNISQACTGTLISLCNHYFRYTDPSIEIELSDIGKLKLEEYDQLCGIQRAYRTNSNMAKRKNIKYYKQFKQAKNESQNNKQVEK